jgi:hypothetical protein
MAEQTYEFQLTQQIEIQKCKTLLTWNNFLLRWRAGRLLWRSRDAFE